jgi:hypothetical protein
MGKVKSIFSFSPSLDASWRDVGARGCCCCNWTFQRVELKGKELDTVEMDRRELVQNTIIGNVPRMELSSKIDQERPETAYRDAIVISSDRVAVGWRYSSWNDEGSPIKGDIERPDCMKVSSATGDTVQLRPQLQSRVTEGHSCLRFFTPFASD